ncbi:2Fe-2S iron-sulfur cluster-binding protein [Kineosporia sp. A_224]|uniref:2Fe-2S iron-sulfur cluster-binding protein n=1 Tax=Kineosporia sp. A_224 TaxID=1962180 RepID=UPI001E329A93|nr:2Fe-2S iron-sulfur cluster-binding protein [Kineosporia sp. A_224]
MTGTAAASTAAASTAAVPVQVRIGDVDVACGPGETVLLSALRAGWDLPYECASGGCGSCKAVLTGGEVRSLWPDAPGLSDRDRRKGDRVLACQSVPAEGCALRLPGTAGPQRAASGPGARPVPGRRPARIGAVLQLSADTVLVTVVPDRPVAYLAGQFVLLELPDGTRRAYSMSREPADAPAGDDRLELVVRRVPGGRASSWLAGATAGDPLVVEGPYGRAHVQSQADRPVVCVGGGSGLGPVLAVAERCLTEAPSRPVRLYYGARTDADVVLAARLRRLRSRGARVDVVTDVPPSAAAAGRLAPLAVRAGRVVDAVDADHPGPADLTGHDVYLAGPTPMVDALLASLVRTGRVGADRTFFDRFL